MPALLFLPHELINIDCVWQYRKPAWWLVLADDKSNRVVVPPMKIADVPFSKPEQDRDYRSYKLQFQAPNGVGLFTWKVYLVSDTFVGEEICEDIAVGVILRSLNITDPDTFRVS
jgi:preprotein translocase subunit Sec63